MSDEETPYDAGDAQAVRVRARTAKQREDAHQKVIRQVMGSNEGRAWIYDLLSICHVFSSSFSQNALTMAHAEGERNIGLRITGAIVSASPERYLEMLKENSSE